MQSRSETILKNTIMLYIRMGITLLVSLWTTRVVLKNLGVEDFGIFAIVGEIVIFFLFLGNAIDNAAGRFMNYELGKGNIEKLNKIFASLLLIYAGIGGLILLLSETIGLWFLNAKLKIPVSRYFAANLVYQFFIFFSIFSLIFRPYNNLIVVHEKMEFFAYQSLLESIIKIVGVLVLTVIPMDKLIFFAILMAAIYMSMSMFAVYFCIRKFPETAKYRFYYEKDLNKELMKYTGWSLLNGACGNLFSRGTNFLINLFFGVTINAAVGLAHQIEGAVYRFVCGFQDAFRPQIIKLYAEEKTDLMKQLVYSSAKISFILLLALSVPFFLDIEYLLHLWLGSSVPAHTANFVRLILCTCLLISMEGPLWMAINATGNIKFQTISICILNVFSLGVGWLVLKLGYPPESIFFVYLLIEFGVLLTRIVLLKIQLNFSIMIYLRKVFFPLSLLFLFVLLPSFCMQNFISHHFLCLVVSILFAWILLCSGAWFFVFEKTEQKLVTQIIQKKFNNFTHKFNGDH